MIGSVVDQNKSLSGAANSPKDTSHRNDQSNKYSAKIAAGSSRGSDLITGDPKLNKNIIKTSAKKIKGSFEGLDTGTSAVLQFNGSGYDNPSVQKARYGNKPTHTSSSSFKNSFTLNKNYSIMNNYSSMTTQGSSSNRLSDIVKNNMMF